MGWPKDRDRLQCMFRQSDSIEIEEDIDETGIGDRCYRRITNYRSKGSRIEIQLRGYDADHGYGPDVWFRVGRDDNVLVSYKPRLVLGYSI